METKEFSFFLDGMDFKAQEGKAHMFRGYLSTSTLDLVNDVVTKECMEDMLSQIRSGVNGFAPSIKGSEQHDVVLEKNPMKIPISRITNANVNDKGLFIEGEFNEDHPDFNRYWAMATKGFLDGLSIEYIAKDVKYDGDVRYLKKVQLTGYGHAPRPVNKECVAEIFVKSMDAFPKLLNEVNILTEPIIEPKVEVKEEVVVSPVPESVTPEPVEPEPVEPEPEIEEVKAKVLTETEIKAIVKEALKDYEPALKSLVQPQESVEEVKAQPITTLSGLAAKMLGG